MKYALMVKEKATFTVVRMARLLTVSRSGFYAWIARRGSVQRRRREGLKVKIIEAHTRSTGVYGAPRITAELRAAGEIVTRKTVAKLMSEIGIAGISPRAFVPVSSEAKTSRTIPDLVNRRFDTGVPDTVWTTDLTYLRTGQG